MTNDEFIRWAVSCYPLTIISDRYSGCYSRGRFTAWPLYPGEIPEDQDGCDISCSVFWGNYADPVGKGETPELAFEDLKQKIRTVASAYGWHENYERDRYRTMFPEIFGEEPTE